MERVNLLKIDANLADLFDKYICTTLKKKYVLFNLKG